MNPLGLNYKMRTEPLLPLLQGAALVYPSGGISSPAKPGCAVGLSIRRERKGTANKPEIREVILVLAWAVDTSLDSLIQSLQAQQWNMIMISRTPEGMFSHVRETLSPLRTYPEGWDDDTVVALANTLLKRAPLSAPGKFLALCENQPAARKALATAVACLGKLAGQVSMNQGPLGHRVSGSWYGPRRVDTSQEENTQ